jgi:hypothetical protein
MRTPLVAVAVLLSLALTGAWTAPVSAQTVRVIVDGSSVAFDQPPIVTGGRVLIPLRGVFEQLGAFVQWNPANNTILATRAGTEVQLTIGSRIAFVNGSQVTLDVPAMVVAGRTLVPLRFVSEAMGAHVQWEAVSRTVYVTSSGAVQPVPPRVIQPPPGPRQAFIQGSVVRVDAGASRLYVQQGDQVYTVIVTSDTAITSPSGSISLSQLRVGDAVTVTLNPQGHAIAIRSTTASQPPAGSVRITSVTHNAQGALRVGDVLTVRMRGTPGGDAFFTIEGVTGAIAMTERQSGLYVGRYTIPSPFLVQNARVLVTLNVDGRVATAIAPTPITVSGSANATLAILSPASGASVGNPVVVRGIATPGSRVTVRVDYRGTVLLFPVSGTYGEVTTTADASGNWQVSIRPSVRVPNATLTITAQAEDPLGREANPITVQATQG